MLNAIRRFICKLFGLVMPDEYHECQIKCNTLEDICERLTAENEKLQENLGTDVSKLKEELQTVTKELNETKAKNEELTESLNRAKELIKIQEGTIDGFETVKKLLEDELAKNDALTKELDEAKAKIAEYEQNAEDVEKLKVAVSSLTEEKTKLENENKLFKESNDSLKASIAEKEEENSTLKEANKSLEVQLDAEKELNSKVMETVSEYEKQISGLKSEINSLKTDLANYNDELEKAGIALTKSYHKVSCAIEDERIKIDIDGVIYTKENTPIEVFKLHGESISVRAFTEDPEINPENIKSEKFTNPETFVTEYRFYIAE